MTGYQMGDAVWIESYRVSLLGTVTVPADRDHFLVVDVGGHDPFGRYGPRVYVHEVQVRRAQLADRNVWGTPRGDVGRGFCPDCERAESGHFDNCDRFPPVLDSEQARTTLDLPLRPMAVL